MDLELKGKTALITGGSKGIGLATARTMAAEGARVMICSRSAGALGDAAGVIKRETGQTVETLAVDLSELAGVERTTSEALTRLGRLDILVNNAGAIKGGDFLTTPDDEWMRGWSLKLLGYIRMARAIFPVMQKQGGGRIVNVVGAAARNPATTYMMGGTAVSPGPVKTERWDTLQRQQAQAAGKDLETHLAELNKSYPLGRIATPE